MDEPRHAGAAAEEAPYHLTHKHCPCIEFILGARIRYGFQQGQLLHYRLEPNEGTDNEHTPDKLTLAFATADVVLLGRRLDRITDHVADGDLRTVRVLPSRYADLDPSKPYIASITVEPIEKE